MKRDAMNKIFATLAIGACMSATLSAHAAEDWKQQFQKVSDDYFDQVYFHFAPSQGTQVGYHQYDGQLEDFSRGNIDAEITALKAFQKRVEAIKPDPGQAGNVSAGIAASCWRAI